MNKIRVQIVEGKNPIIFVAPHGNKKDDVNTALIAEVLADCTKGYAVINRGWERADNINYKYDKANCNNVEHCHKDVIKEEFLDPLIRFKNRVLKKWSRIFIVYIHGMSDSIQEKTGIKYLNYIVGWGNGHPHSHTCQKWIKNFIIYTLSLGDNCIVGEGKAGGNYAGWTRNNMTQLFRKWYLDDEVDAVQIEISRTIRDTKSTAKTTAQLMAITMEELITLNESWTLPDGFKINKV
jgi:hypothetical protein